MKSVAIAKTDKWIEERLKPLIEEGKSFDVADEMIDLLLTAIAETAFEYTLSPPEIKMFKQGVELALKEFVDKEPLNPLRKVFGLIIPNRRRAHKASQFLLDLSLKIIQSYKALENPLPGTIIDLIMSNRCYKNDLERSADITTLLLVGHDTTAYSLAWTLKELAQNATIQSELREHIRHDAGPKHQLDSVRQTIREAIRLHPVSGAGSGRTVGRKFTTKDRKVIPTGSFVFLPYINMLRDPVVFGPDYDQFRPNRWDKDKVTADMNQAFMPFAVGRQNCVGQPLATAELLCILPHILSQFELTVEQPGTTQCFLTIKPANCLLKAKPVAV